MRGNVSPYKKVIFIIVIMLTSSAEADRYCMIGHKPTEVEFRYAREACEEHAKTIEKLGELVAANPKKIEYKRQFDEKHRLMFQKIDNFTNCLHSRIYENKYFQITKRHAWYQQSTEVIIL